jgi:hypothetical protein
MRRALPLVAVFSTTCLLVVGVWTSLATPAPATPVTSADTTQLTVPSNSATEAWFETSDRRDKWTTTTTSKGPFGSPKRSK